MKTFFQIVLLMCGVFIADADEVKSVSVMEGHSVTLNPDLTQIQGFSQIQWRFGDPVIAQTDGNKISYLSHTEIFRGRLQLDQTGSLTIKNMRTKHTGIYKLYIDLSTGSLQKTFSVTVYESPSAIDAGEAEMKIMSVMEGNSVTLQTEPHGDELIVWRFGDEGQLIAKADIETKSSTLYDTTDERFKDRLQLDHQTGSLIITSTRITDSGLYKLQISSSKQTLYKRFIVTVSVITGSGLSQGIVAGIVVVLLLVVAAAAAGIYYYRRTYEKQIVKCMEGDFAFLSSGVNEIKEDDQMLWTFGDEESPIATMSKREKTTYFYDNKKRFRGRLQLDPQTGSLIIRNLRKTDSGLYKLQIKSKRSHKKYQVTVSGEVTTLRVKEGEDVTLKFDHFTLQNVFHIKWFRDERCIVSLATENKHTAKSNSCGGRFKDRLVLDSKTGFLTIKNLRPEHTGVYKVRSNLSAHGYRKFNIIFDDSTENWSNESVGEMKRVSIKEGYPLKLNTDTQIQPDDEILLMFGTVFKPRHPYEIIARINKPDNDEFKSAEKKFKELKLDHTGSVTISITKTKTEHCGDYYVQITNKKNKSFKTFTFIVTDDDEHETEPMPLDGGPDEYETEPVPLDGGPDEYETEPVPLDGGPDKYETEPLTLDGLKLPVPFYGDSDDCESISMPSYGDSDHCETSAFGS